MQRFSRVIGLVLAVLLAACASAPRAPDAVVRGALDAREYRYLELPNRLRVLLVSDPAADKSAASLRVSAGSGDDPADRQGLAHFLEHMLFLGTAKYPDPGEYQEFINAHGGSHNAYTAVDHTLYFFDIEPGSLEPALDRFSQFFVAPLFTPDYVQREMNAVDSEYRMGLKDDARREYDVLRELVQPGHPLAKLAVGNLQTLNEAPRDIQDDLLDFHRRHYSANLMTLVVLGKQPLDALEAMVRPRFGPIEDRRAEAKTTAPAMFAPGALPLEVRIRPEKETRELSMLFPVPSTRARPAAKPLDYIANLIGHEGPGGLLSVLREKGWAEAVGAGAGFDLYGEDALQVTVQLTEAGLANRDAVVALVFASIDRIREGGVEAWRYAEQAQLGELGFRFREKGSATGAVISLANALQEYPVADVLRGPYLYADYDEALIRDCLDRLRPDNLLLTITDHSVQTDRQSRWFQTPYGLDRPDPARLAGNGAAAALALPAPNEFIPRRLDAKPLDPAAPAVPALVAEEPGYRLWHLQDPDFRAPRASVFVQLLSGRAVDTPRDAALAALFANLVQDGLNEYAYPATLAGLQYAVAPSARGLTVRVSGYDDRLGVLLDKIRHALARASFPAERFEAQKTELLRQWGNSRRERPFVQLVDGLGNTMLKRGWSDAELREALAGATGQDLDRFAQAFRASASVEMLVHGNVRVAEAKALGEATRDALRGAAPGPVPAIEVLALPAGEARRAFAIEHPDSALLMYLQGGGTGYAERARIALSAQVIAPAFFNELRTERQLGYAVFAQPYPLARAPGLLLAVQSPAVGPAALAREFEAFLARQATSLGELGEDEFLRHRQTLAERLRESPKSLADKSERLWADLGLGAGEFDDRERVAAEVEKIGREDWLAFFREQLAGPGRRALLLYSRGEAHRAEKPAALPGHPVGAAGNGRADAKYYRFDWRVPVQSGAGTTLSGAIATTPADAHAEQDGSHR